jgi:hypothetical protein
MKTEKPDFAGFSLSLSRRTKLRESQEYLKLDHRVILNFKFKFIQVVAAVVRGGSGLIDQHFLMYTARW